MFEAIRPKGKLGAGRELEPFAAAVPHDVIDDPDHLVPKNLIEAALLDWRNRPGERIGLEAPLGPQGLDEKALSSTLVAEHQSPTETPDRSICELKHLTMISLNAQALGEQRQDYTADGKGNRERTDMTVTEQKVLAFIAQQQKENCSIFCMQDFPIYRLKVLGPELEKIGFSYYANVSGVNGEGVGHLKALVTLVNIHSAELQGYRIDMPTFSVTPHYQGTHLEETSDGKRIVHGEINIRADRGDRYADARVKNLHCLHTFDTTLTLQGVDGSRKIAIGNMYMAFSSHMGERAWSVRASLKNTAENAGDDGIAIDTGDMNTYGYDSARCHLGYRPYPVVTVLSVLMRRYLREVRHIAKIGERLGFKKSNREHNITIPVPGGGGLLGMELDHTFAKGDGVQIESKPIPAPSDHYALKSVITIDTNNTKK